jgi:serine/threonine protein kinase
VDDGSAVATGELAGSPAYISPEQLVRGGAWPASDLFSLGATLFAAVENRAPFDKGGDLFATLTAVVQDAPGPFRNAGPLRPVIGGLLTKEPERRLGADRARAALREVQRRCSTAGSPTWRSPSTHRIGSPGTVRSWTRRWS